MRLPAQLLRPYLEGDDVACKVMLDLTVYLAGPSESELEFLISLYERFCPVENLVKYKIAEIEYWSFLSAPDLTRSGRQAAAEGRSRPFIEPVRRRIRDGRAFELRFWDGKTIDESNGSWSFTCRRIHFRNAGRHAVLRVLFPLQTDLAVVRKMAAEVADNVDFLSGHCGLTFAYDPWLKESAFDHIYARSKRYWGVDIEDLNATLPVDDGGIKAVSWITMLGQILSSSGLSPRDLVDACIAAKDAELERKRRGYLITIGTEPTAGDVNRSDIGIAPYFRLAKALEPLFLTDHPDFAGELFAANANTIGWVRRFIDPDGWR